MSSYSEKLRREKREELALRIQLVKKEELSLRVETAFTEADAIELGLLKKIADAAKSVLFDEKKHPRGKDGKFATSSGSSSSSGKVTTEQDNPFWKSYPNKEVDSLNKKIDAISTEQQKVLGDIDAQVAQVDAEFDKLSRDSNMKNADANFYAMTKLEGKKAKLLEQHHNKHYEFENKKSPLVKKRGDIFGRLHSDSEAKNAKAEAKNAADKAKVVPKPIPSGQRKPSMI